LPTSRVRVPRHVSWLVVDYSASRKLVVDYFAYTARLSASAHCAAHRVARRRLLRLTQVRTPRVRVPRHVAHLVAQLIVDYSASRRLIVDYFAYTTRPGASARRAARRVARGRLLCLRRTSRCLGTSRGSLHGSSSTTSPTLRVRVPRLLSRIVVKLVPSRHSTL
jgi:hypothetical protein